MPKIALYLNKIRGGNSPSERVSQSVLNVITYNRVIYWSTRGSYPSPQNIMEQIAGFWDLSFEMDRPIRA